MVPLNGSTVPRVRHVVASPHHHSTTYLGRGVYLQVAPVGDGLIELPSPDVATSDHQVGHGGMAADY